MDKLFIEARSGLDIKEVIEKAADLLPENTGIVTTAQHKHRLDEIKDILEEKGIKAEIGGQVLGCDAGNAVKIKDKADAFLYVGSGKFHPIQIQIETGKDVIIANPFAGEVNILDKEESEKIKKKQKGAFLKFLDSENIGILVSTKPGQQNLKKAFELKQNLKKKNCYVFMADFIDYSQLQNFPFIGCWINTACPRFADDKKGVLNHGYLEKNL